MCTASFRTFGPTNGYTVIAMYNNFIYLWIHFWLPEIQLIANLLTNKVLIIFRNSTYCKSSTHLSHELHLGNFFFCLIDLWDLHDQGQENNVTLEGVLLPGTNMLAAGSHKAFWYTYWWGKYLFAYNVDAFFGVFHNGTEWNLLIYIWVVST